MSSPKISVCVDVYNYADYLPKAIESVLAQTFRDLEVIVVDDCSTDNSFAVARQYAQQDGRVRVHRNAQNLGMVKNRNVCLRLARGEYVKFVHADDFLCSPDALARLLAKLEANPAVSLVAGAMQYVDAQGRPGERSRGYFNGQRYLAGPSVIARCLAEQKNLIGGPSAVMFRRDRAGRGFDENYFHAADQEMWFHLLEQGCFGYVDEPVIAYRWHERQQTEKDRLTLTQANDNRALLATYLEKPYLRFRRRLKAYLKHDAARNIVERSRRIGQPEAGAQAVREFGGALPYYGYYPVNWLWRRLLKKCARPVYQRGLPYYATKAPIALPPQFPKGINLAGFLKSEFGIGESSRAFARAVGEASFPSALFNIQSTVHRNEDHRAKLTGGNNAYGVNLMTFSFDYSRRFFLDQGESFFQGRYNIALWYWELEHFPIRWHSNFDYYDEIWAPTEFCRQALAAVSPVPVHKITYPYYLEPAPQRNRAAFGLSESTYAFLFNFDFHSTLIRKNPYAVINAFRQAFSPSEDATLVLKSINSEKFPEARREMEQALKGLRVVWIEPHLSHQEMATLFASADCYVSLHRSEGLGLGLVQAMALGKPVIGTAYSGNMDFMNPGNSRLVKYNLIEVQEDSGSYEKGQGNVWADADVAEAARHMRWAFDHRAESTAMGLRAAADIRSILSPEKTRAEIQARLDAIYRRNGQ